MTDADINRRTSADGVRSLGSEVKAGKVWLIGGGPGTDDLITVRGQRLLDTADVIVADHP